MITGSLDFEIKIWETLTYFNKDNNINNVNNTNDANHFYMGTL